MVCKLNQMRGYCCHTGAGAVAGEGTAEQHLHQASSVYGAVPDGGQL